MGSRHLALIRGINVGRAKRVAMADLRTLLEGLGYTDVQTLLNSGNIVFTVPGKSRASNGPKIEKAMATELGVSARVFVLTASELADVIVENPLLKVATDHSRLLVMVLGSSQAGEQLGLLTKSEWARTFSPSAVERPTFGVRVGFSKANCSLPSIDLSVTQAHPEIGRL